MWMNWIASGRSLAAKRRDMRRFLANLKLACYFFFTYRIRIKLTMTETQLAQLKVLSVALTDKADANARIDVQVDGDNQAIKDRDDKLASDQAALKAAYDGDSTVLQATLATDTATKTQAEADVETAMNNLLAYAANPPA
jgi:hypothetical protein